MEPSQINLKWLDALTHPLPPIEVSAEAASVKEVVLTGE